jgi:HAD superfamily hydrolase (TIGR01549 family)
MREIYEYKAVVFDMDGTLYFQKPFRVRMLCFLLGHLISHPTSLKDLMIIKKYREVREHWTEENDNLDKAQYEYVAKLKHTSKEHVQTVIEYYMHKVPLKFLLQYRDNELAKLIDNLKEKGIKVIIYSDYPSEDKLKALEISADYCYCSADPRIGTMKPDPKGLKVILSDMKLDSKEVLMVGDRMENDGLAAQANDMDYYILSASPKKRKKL